MTTDNRYHPAGAERLGAMYRQRRKAASMSQQAVAEQAEVGIATVGRLERGLAVPAVNRLARMCAVVPTITPHDLRGVGQGDAADLLHVQREAVPPELGAIARANEILIGAGWAVTMKGDGRGGFMLHAHH